MLVQIVTENGVKKVIPLTADAGAGLPVGFIAPAYKKGNYSGWLYLDGRDTTGTSEELSTHYPLLYALLGSNILPDYREFALVGAEQNTTDTIANHDVYTQGQAKDDQLQEHTHNILNPMINATQPTPITIGAGSQTIAYATSLATTSDNARHGTVTRGKRKAVYFYIKATSGLSENAQDNVVAQLNEERSYSTSEVNTGKKWIDGKPIYRKVAVFSSELTVPSDTWTTTEVSSSGISTIINILGINDLGANFPIAGTRDQGDYIKILSYRNLDITVKTLILEYTKTTD